jgi:predicted metal-dependent enzyme (double-stranded beta helix superfamily)
MELASPTAEYERDGVHRLIERLDAAVLLDGTKQITRRIKHDLTDLIRSGEFQLPQRFLAPRDECYARRLLHRDRDLRYTVVVMTWGIGQETPLHDHAGMWCVEAVAAGEMNVIQFDLIEDAGDLCRFERTSRVAAGLGASGSLIPPFEYHVLGNALDDRASATVHVYGGEMERCCTFLPRENDWYVRTQKDLPYHD